jgi:hypothetical protein
LNVGLDVDAAGVMQPCRRRQNVEHAIERQSDDAPAATRCGAAPNGPFEFLILDGVDTHVPADLTRLPHARIFEKKSAAQSTHRFLNAPRQMNSIVVPWKKVPVSGQFNGEIPLVA